MSLSSLLAGLLLRPAVRYSRYAAAARNALTDTPQEEILRKVMEYVKYSKLDGDYVEFGVYRGFTITAAFQFAQRNGLNAMNIYAFDSFQGLPKPSGKDAKVAQFSEGEYLCGLSDFRRNLAKAGVDMRRVHVVPGWYSETLTTKTREGLPLKSAAVVYVDCDLYESAVRVLDFVGPYLGDGSVIIFDDWFCFRGRPELGEQAAFREFLKKHPSISVSEFIRFGWHGNSFIVHMSPKIGASRQAR